MGGGFDFPFQKVRPVWSKQDRTEAEPHSRAWALNGCPRLRLQIFHMDSDRQQL